MTTQKYSTFSAVERSFLRYILHNPQYSRWQIGSAIRRGYAPDVIQYLKQKGFYIRCQMLKTSERQCAIGHYSLALKLRQKAILMLSKNEF